MIAPHYAQNYSISRTFWKLDGFANEKFGAVRHKRVHGKSCYSLTENREGLPTQKFFRNQDKVEIEKGCPTKIFGTVRPQLFHAKM